MGPKTKGSSAQPATGRKEGDGKPRLTLTVNEHMFGIRDESAVLALGHQIVSVTPNYNEENGRDVKGALATLAGIAPTNVLEGLLAVQMIGVHNLAIEYMRRASLTGQTTECVDRNVHRAVRLMQTFSSQLEALHRHRGKITQQMVVGSVNVSNCGQAIVGPVSNSGDGKVATEHDWRKVG